MCDEFQPDPRLTLPVLVIVASVTRDTQTHERGCGIHRGLAVAMGSVQVDEVGRAFRGGGNGILCNAALLTAPPGAFFARLGQLGPMGGIAAALVA